MLHIIMIDLVPIYVIMLLGYFSGKAKAFDGSNAQTLNKLVLNYALPAALFVSIVKADRAMLFSDLRLTIVSLCILVGCYFVVYFIAKKGFKHTKGEAAVSGLISGSPTIGFLGFAILEPIYGATPSVGLVIAIVAIVVNAIEIPIGLTLLNSSLGKVGADGKKPSPWAPMVNALKQPVAWAPILAVIIVLLGIRFPSIFDPSFNLIAKANSGVAVFAAGVTLSTTKFIFDKEVAVNTFLKLLFMPGVILGIGLLVGMTSEHLQMLVLCAALPPAFSGIIIASRYQTYVATGTSALAVSTFLFMLTAPFWIWFAKLIAG